MDNKSFVPDNIPADLHKSWHIPRPTLARSSNSSQGSTSSKSSTQSARSGASLLTATNLAKIHQQETTATDHSNDGKDGGASQMNTRDQNIQYYLEKSIRDNELIAALPKTDKKPEPDNLSLASSCHFTVVNVNTRQRQPQRSFCRKHQLTVLVLTMCSLFTIGILTAIFLLELRAKKLRQ